MPPQAPPLPSVKPPISKSDLTISIIVLVMTALMGAGAAVLGVFMLAFLDSCPPETCSADGAFTAIATSVLIAFVVGLVGVVVTIVRLVRRTPAWPVAVGALMLCGLVCVLGIVGYVVAVGG
jgi:hypothetical protein